MATTKTTTAITQQQQQQQQQQQSPMLSGILNVPSFLFLRYYHSGHFRHC